jgi:hypothetical protein
VSEQSDRAIALLQELAALKDVEESGGRHDAAESRKRQKEIGKELKQLARNKKKSE